jgi:hypothetical protein
MKDGLLGPKLLLRQKHECAMGYSRDAASLFIGHRSPSANEFHTRRSRVARWPDFYRMARRSATESAAILDACRLLSLIDTDKSQQGRDLLLRVVAMLTAMVVKISGAGSDSGSGAGSDPVTNLQ